jgi:hypothetical protein
LTQCSCAVRFALARLSRLTAEICRHRQFGGGRGPDGKFDSTLCVGGHCASFSVAGDTGIASAAITVTNTNDTGAGSLRAAITTANGSPTVATAINFSVSGTITLGSALPAIANSSPNGSLTIDGSGQSITVYGVSSYQIFSVNSGATLNLRNLTINDGLATDGGGADNAGILTVTNCTFSDNFADLGGGIDNEVDGTLTVTNTTFAGNVTPNGLGGGISNDGGTMTVTNSTFSGNSATGGLGGGGIFNAGGATLKGNVLAGESGGNCGFSSPTDAGYNISDDTTCGFGKCHQH